MQSQTLDNAKTALGLTGLEFQKNFDTAAFSRNYFRKNGIEVELMELIQDQDEKKLYCNFGTSLDVRAIPSSEEATEIKALIRQVLEALRNAVNNSKYTLIIDGLVCDQEQPSEEYIYSNIFFAM
jgi:hypothetical protein